jgi:hypothetical protein
VCVCVHAQYDRGRVWPHVAGPLKKSWTKHSAIASKRLVAAAVSWLIDIKWYCAGRDDDDDDDDDEDESALDGRITARLLSKKTVNSIYTEWPPRSLSSIEYVPPFVGGQSQKNHHAWDTLHQPANKGRACVHVCACVSPVVKRVNS